MRISIGIVCSVLGAAVAFYLAIITLVTLPPDGALRWFAIAGIAGLSLIAGVLINGVSMQDFFKVSRAYNTLTSRLSPLLYNGMEDVLQKRIKDLDLFKGLQLNTLAPIGGLYRVVASTYPREAVIRQIEFEPNEGLNGLVVDRKVAGYTQSQWVGPKHSDVYDCSGQVIGQRGKVRDVNRGKTVHGSKWIYGHPIFEKSGATPWSNQVVGILLVHSKADDGDSLFKNSDFQLQVDSLASDLAPYLDALQTLMAEKKS